MNPPAGSRRRSAATASSCLRRLLSASRSLLRAARYSLLSPGKFVAIDAPVTRAAARRRGPLSRRARPECSRLEEKYRQALKRSLRKSPDRSGWFHREKYGAGASAKLNRQDQGLDLPSSGACPVQSQVLALAPPLRRAPRAARSHGSAESPNSHDAVETGCSHQ